MTEKLIFSEPLLVPALAIRDIVVYPYVVVPLFVNRKKSIRALEVAMKEGKQVFLVAQKEAANEEPVAKDLYTVGTLATVLQLLKLPDGTLKILVEGVQRARIVNFIEEDAYFLTEIEAFENVVPDRPQEISAFIRALQDRFAEYVRLNKKIPVEVLSSLASVDDPGRFADTLALHLPLKVPQKQKILEMEDVCQRLEHTLLLIDTEIELVQVEQRIHARLEGQLEKNKRRFYLDEKAKAIQKELGELDPTRAQSNDLEELTEKIEKAGMPQEAKEKALSELSKLKLMPPMSAEATVLRGYLDWLLKLPWMKSSKITQDLAKAQASLEADHYGLEKVKERIIEYLAVQQRVRKLKGPILCLVGPPGVGKTSIGKSVAKAANREFVRMSLGGVRDEAEIRGHRRTYVGSLPGKIIQKIVKSKVKNPLFMLDEIDKMAMDFRGDPASALLEVLDPEQNATFNDHYLEIDYDLSHVMFIATANSLNIPPALLDRMEIIRLAGYTEQEKLEIATRYLLPKQIKNNGLKKGEIQITEGALCEIIRYYTREAGVRDLDRDIAKICRKVVKQALTNAKQSQNKKSTSQKQKTFIVTQRSIEKYLGVKRYRYGVAKTDHQVGQVNGLAWTEFGGELLTIETAVMPGKGNGTYTGSLGDVMQESIKAAMTVVRSRAAALGLKEDFYEKVDIHVHVPEGATPKDGPSAGIGMCTALVSSLTGVPVRSDVAMTGEITLRGEVLPIGGVKEKLLAALRAGIKRVVIPEDSLKDLKEIPKTILKDLEICPVKWIDEVFGFALMEAVLKPFKPEESQSAKAFAEAEMPT